MSDFSNLVRSWLRSKGADRSLEDGALIALRIHGNEYKYRAMLRSLKASEPEIERILSAYLTRSDSIPSKLEAQQIKQEAIQLVEAVKVSDNTEHTAKNGLRADHDSLPDDIKAIFERNMSLKRQMSQYHLELRNLLKSTKDCASADIKTIVELLKEADVEYRNNWKLYDGYKG